MKSNKQTQTTTPDSAPLMLRLVKKSSRFVILTAVFLLLSQMFALLSNINGKHIPESYFSNGLPSIIGLFDSEFFMGLIFMVTLSVVAYVIYLLWQLHEIAVHKSEKVKSHQANVVFALSLCGLFLHKAWWVLAIIIAFTNWHAISTELSRIIRNGRTLENEQEG